MRKSTRMDIALTITKCVAAVVALLMGVLGTISETKEAHADKHGKKRLTKSGKIYVALIAMGAFVSLSAEIIQRLSDAAKDRQSVLAQLAHQKTLLTEVARAVSPLGNLAIGLGIRYEVKKYPWKTLVAKHILPKQCACFVRLKRGDKAILDMKLDLNKPFITPHGEVDFGDDNPSSPEVSKVTQITNTVFYPQEALYVSPAVASTMDLSECAVLVFFVDQGGYLINPKGEGKILSFDFPQGPAAKVMVGKIVFNAAGNRKLDVYLKRDAGGPIFRGVISSTPTWR